jgi:hypothetical protein
VLKDRRNIIGSDSGVIVIEIVVKGFFGEKKIDVYTLGGNILKGGDIGGDNAFGVCFQSNFDLLAFQAVVGVFEYFNVICIVNDTDLIGYESHSVPPIFGYLL